MPVRNEADSLVLHIQQLLHILPLDCELIVVDGESNDGSPELLQPLLAQDSRLQLLTARAGRAAQMNAGAQKARGGMLLFLHADTSMSMQSWEEFRQTVNLAQHELLWGRFDVRIIGQSVWLPLIAFMMNWRSALTQICTGDQGLFMTRALFNRVGRFPDLPLMEDIEMTKRLKTQLGAQFVRLRGRMETSGRRWDQMGVWPTIWLMWRFRFQYWRGVNAYDLARQYREIRSRPPADYPMKAVAHDEDLSR